MDVLVVSLMAFLVVSPLLLVFKGGDSLRLSSPTLVIIFIQVFGVVFQSASFFVSERYSGVGALYPALFLVALFNVFYVFGFLSGVRVPSLSLDFGGVVNNKYVKFGLISLSFILVFEFFSIFGFFSYGFSSAKRFVVQNDVEYSYSFLRVGADIVLVSGLVFFVRYMANGGRLFLFLSFFLLSISLVFFWFVSSRLNVGVAIISFSMVYSFFKKEAVFAYFKYFLVFTLVASVFSLMTVIRSDKDGAIDRGAVASGMEVQLSQLTSGNYFFTVHKASKVIKEVDSLNDYKLGVTLLSPFYFFVPRTLWEGKPPVRFGEVFSQEVYKNSGDSGIPPSFPVELYWNFSWFGVILGALVFGVYCKSFLVEKVRKMDVESASLNSSVFACFFIIPLMANDFANGVISFLMARTVLAVFRMRGNHEKSGY